MGVTIMCCIDLHLHTTASDGSCTPAEVVHLAKEAGVIAIGITDHDTMNGVTEAVAMGKAIGIEVLPGIELSTDYCGQDTHVLGYGNTLSVKGTPLENAIHWMQQERRRRNERIIEYMRRDGISVTMEELMEQYPGATIGKPHFAQLLISRGLASDVEDAFSRYLHAGKRYYVPRSYLPMERAVEAIRASGGLAVLAHPLQYRYDRRKLHDMVKYASNVGVQGLEVYYTGYDEEQRAELIRLAKKFDLVITGGSDFHGTNKPGISVGRGDGTLVVPARLLEALKKRMEEAKL